VARYGGALLTENAPEGGALIRAVLPMAPAEVAR
jgi:hypothetical protein